MRQQDWHWSKVEMETDALGCLIEETTDDTGVHVILSVDLTQSDEPAEVDLNDPNLPCFLRRQAE